MKENARQAIKAGELALAFALACVWLVVQLVPLRGIPFTAEEAP